MISWLLVISDLTMLFQMSDVLNKVPGDEDWGSALLDVKPQVILHDRLMTDAALGTMPIKSEHSYCSLSTGTESGPDSPLKMEGESKNKSQNAV